MALLATNIALNAHQLDFLNQSEIIKLMGVEPITGKLYFAKYLEEGIIFNSIDNRNPNDPDFDARENVYLINPNIMYRMDLEQSVFGYFEHVASLNALIVAGNTKKKKTAAKKKKTKCEKERKIGLFFVHLNPRNACHYCIFGVCFLCKNRCLFCPKNRFIFCPIAPENRFIFCPPRKSVSVVGVPVFAGTLVCESLLRSYIAFVISFSDFFCTLFLGLKVDYGLLVILATERTFFVVQIFVSIGTKQEHFFLM